ncbi:hypothetical protein Gotur_033809 [Gossypium turneri]
MLGWSAAVGLTELGCGWSGFAVATGQTRFGDTGQVEFGGTGRLSELRSGTTRTLLSTISLQMVVSVCGTSCCGSFYPHWDHRTGIHNFEPELEQISPLTFLSIFCFFFTNFVLFGFGFCFRLFGFARFGILSGGDEWGNDGSARVVR